MIVNRQLGKCGVDKCLRVFQLRATFDDGRRRIARIAHTLARDGQRVPQGVRSVTGRDAGAGLTCNGAGGERFRQGAAARKDPTVARVLAPVLLWAHDELVGRRLVPLLERLCADVRYTSDIDAEALTFALRKSAILIVFGSYEPITDVRRLRAAGLDARVIVQAEELSTAERHELTHLGVVTVYGRTALVTRCKAELIRLSLVRRSVPPTGIALDPLLHTARCGSVVARLSHMSSHSFNSSSIAQASRSRSRRSGLSVGAIRCQHAAPSRLRSSRCTDCGENWTRSAVRFVSAVCETSDIP